MSKVKPLTPQESSKFSFLLKAVKKNMGFVPNSIKTMARVPAIMASFSLLAGLITVDRRKASPLMAFKLVFKNLGWTKKFIDSPNRVPLYLRNLVAYACSNAAGCRYCQAHTIGEALHNGTPKEKVEAIWDFENSSLFDDKEKAALRFGFAAGSVPNAVTKDHFVELRKHFTEEQIVELGATISVFGFLNRWNDTFATELEPEPTKIAQEFLAPHGWTIGKHTS